MKLKCLLGALYLCASSSVWAGSSLDGRLSGSSVELDDGEDEIKLEGVGIDARGHFELTDHLFLRANILATSGDEGEVNGDSFDVDSDLTVFRGGGGYQGAVGAVVLFGAAEYGKVKLKISGDGGSVVGKDNGFILTGGIKDSGEGKFLWEAELGLLAFDDSEGAAFDFTLGYRFNPSFALIGGGQAYALEDDDNVEYAVASATVGVRFSF